MNVLVFCDNDTIHGWLIDEADRADEHIRNGYPHLQARWQAGEVTAKVVDVPQTERYRPEFYRVSHNTLARKDDAEIKQIETALQEALEAEPSATRDP